jgi:hypothetical protein
VRLAKNGAGGARTNATRDLVFALVLGAALAPLVPLSAFAQAGGALPPDLVLEVMERHAQGLEDVDLYVKVLDASSTLGPQIDIPTGTIGPCAGKVCEGVKVEHGTLADGSTKIAAELPQSPEQMGARAGITNSALLRRMGFGLYRAQREVNDLFGLPETGRGPMMPAFAWMDPFSMFAIGGSMMLSAAKAVGEAEQANKNSASTGATERNRTAELLSGLKLTGKETHQGIEVQRFDYSAPDTPTKPNPPAAKAPTPAAAAGDENDEDWISAATILIDPNHYRFLKQRMEGTAVVEGKPRDFYIEIEYSDFRNPPGCGEMDQPFRRVTRMGGLLDEKEMAEIEKARAELAKFEQQLATMPAQQRQMMERMMGSQMQTMRNLVNSGTFEYVEQTERIICNPDLAKLFSVAPEHELDQDLIRQIQEYLVILGYEPGNVDGVLDDLTRVAISQFQAERDLPVTGEPSVQLAALLADAVGA